MGWISTCRPGFHGGVDGAVTLALPPRERDLDVADEEPVVVALAREPHAELSPQIPGAWPGGQDDVREPRPTTRAGAATGLLVSSAGWRVVGGKGRVIFLYSGQV